MWVDCDDRDAEILSKRILTYLASLGAINVQVVNIEDMKAALTNK